MCDIKGFSYNELFLLAVQKPVMAQIELTKNCNQSCFFCFRSCRPGRKYEDEPLVKWKRAINKLVDLGVEEINFSGGEIFLFTDIDGLCAHAKKRGIKKIVINTNGVADLKKNKLSNIDLLVFSIHGLGAGHDNITGLPGSFDSVSQSLRQAVKKGIAIGINTVVSKNNINNLSDIKNHFDIFPLAFHSFNYNISDVSSAESADFKKYLSFLKTVRPERLKLRHGMQNIFINDRFFFLAPIPLPHCAAGKYKMVVDYKGDVYPCRYFQTKKFLCGNIFRDNAKKIWKDGKGFNFFRKQITENVLPEKCVSCFKKNKCRGGCLAWRKYDKNLKIYGEDTRCAAGDAYIRG